VHTISLESSLEFVDQLNLLAQDYLPNCGRSRHVLSLRMSKAINRKKSTEQSP
jgi:hypothetical protein